MQTSFRVTCMETANESGRLAANAIQLTENGGDGNDASMHPSISANGLFVAFASSATNLAPGVDSNARLDVMVWDRTNTTIERHKTLKPSGS